MLGHDLLGDGDHKVVVLNDWIGDTTTWAGARAYLGTARFVWAFTDLRGYGRSRGQSGSFTVEEAAGDVLELADSLGWERCSVVGHSMSCLVALHLAQTKTERLRRGVVLTPPPPRGFGVDGAMLEALRAVGFGDDARRLKALQRMLGDRLNEGWARFKLDRWRACADPAAVAGYISMFAQRGLPHPVRAISIPVLAVTGEQDSEPLRSQAVRGWLEPLCPRAQVVPMAECGHYPMQEMPPLLATIVERFLAEG